MGLAAEFENLRRLRDAGVLTDEEFASAKTRLLAGEAERPERNTDQAAGGPVGPDLDEPLSASARAEQLVDACGIETHDPLRKLVAGMTPHAAATLGDREAVYAAVVGSRQMTPRLLVATNRRLLLAPCEQFSGPQDHAWQQVQGVAAQGGVMPKITLTVNGQKLRFSVTAGSGDRFIAAVRHLAPAVPSPDGAGPHPVSASVTDEVTSDDVVDRGLVDAEQPSRSMPASSLAESLSRQPKGVIGLLVVLVAVLVIVWAGVWDMNRPLTHNEQCVAAALARWERGSVPYENFVDTCWR